MYIIQQFGYENKYKIKSRYMVSDNNTEHQTKFELVCLLVKFVIVDSFNFNMLCTILYVNMKKPGHIFFPKLIIV